MDGERGEGLGGSWWWSDCKNGGAAKWKLKSPFSVVTWLKIWGHCIIHLLSLCSIVSFSLSPLLFHCWMCVCVSMLTPTYFMCARTGFLIVHSLCVGGYVHMSFFIPFISCSSHVDVIKARGQSMTLAKPVHFGPVHVVVLPCIFPQPVRGVGSFCIYVLCPQAT